MVHEMQHGEELDHVWLVRDAMETSMEGVLKRTGYCVGLQVCSCVDRYSTLLLVLPCVRRAWPRLAGTLAPCTTYYVRHTHTASFF